MGNQGLRGRPVLSSLLAASIITAATTVASAQHAPAKRPKRDAPLDFVAQAHRLMRVGACTGNAALARSLPAAHVRKHCEVVRGIHQRFRARWMAKAAPFFARIVPADVPTTLVYPFGGGDLMSALTVFPKARDITTLSLEPAGDPRTIDTLRTKTVVETLAAIRRWLARLVRANHSRTKDMALIMNRGKLPGQLLFTLNGLAIHGYEPVSLRYFVIEPSGTLRYLTQADVDALHTPAGKDARRWRRDRRGWRKARRALWNNMELRFRKRNDPSAPVRVYRHIQGNLEDAALSRDRRTLTHLESKGRVAVMTKAASYLLWWNTFTTMRKYLLTHMAWMVSDATGIPPRFANAAGFEQITWGRWTGNILQNPGTKTVRRMRELWKSNPYQPLTFRFGYPDRAGNHHLMVTRKRR